jgi:EpsI family protein
MKLTNLVMSFVVCALMVATVVLANVMKPVDLALVDKSEFSLERAIPKKFGEWEHDANVSIQMVNPQTQAVLDKIYSQTLTRTYVNGKGQRIMLSLAYGSDQRGSLQAHKPEICYPAQGFSVGATGMSKLATPIGNLGINRMMAIRGQRTEPVTYWFTAGNQQVESAFERRLVELKSLMTGKIPDGLLFRVSSIDKVPSSAYGMHDQFVSQLISVVNPADLSRVFGLTKP